MIFEVREKQWDEKIAFLKNKPGELLKIKGRPKKQTGKTLKQTENKAGHLIESTGMAKKQTGNKPKNKARHFIENKGWANTKRENLHDSPHHAAHRPGSSRKSRGIGYIGSVVTSAA